MSVRGGGLKSSGNFMLFDIPWISPWNWFRLQNYSNPSTWWLFLGKHITTINFQSIWKYWTKSLTTEITDNKFYRVIASYTNKKAKIEIYDWLNKILDSIYINDVSIAPIWTLNDLYIWSSTDKTNQWNDIIDYVKIYKR